jgi:predicted lipoprotein with Yx(FWY)xxD motif
MGTTLIRWLLRVTGAGLLAAEAAIHLDLYLTGYNTIPTIGWLFLVQVIITFALALAILAAPLLVPLIRPAAAADAALAAAGAGFAIATLGGYLLTLWVGLFGFREIYTTAGLVAGLLEVTAFGVLAALALLTADSVLAGLPASRASAGAGASRVAALRRASWSTLGGATVAAFAVLGGSLATANTGSAVPVTGGSAELRTATIGGVSVLTNGSGRTLYWFAPDTSSSSACYGQCAAYWPPVTGNPTAGPGITLSKIGTIARTDGTIQVTYDGHPLYTYIGDTGPGQASGNNVNLNGGLWHEVPAAG